VNLLPQNVHDLGSWEEAVLWLRTQPDQHQLVRACFFDAPLLEAAERYYASAEWIAVRRILAGKHGAALDLGAGRGISSYALARDGWQVSALEPDPSEVVGAGAIRALAREAGLGIRIEQEWGESLPFPDSSFDLVHGRQVLHHAKDLQQLCAEVARVLKPGGLFIATREHVISRAEDLPEFLASHPLHKLYGGEHAYLLDEYLHAIRAGGIVLTKVLNPYESDINLYPDTVTDLKRRLSKRIYLPPAIIPDVLLAALGALSRVPGRLYTFIGRANE
jgi:SAM-dependent methyltransferase